MRIFGIFIGIALISAPEYAQDSRVYRVEARAIPGSRDRVLSGFAVASPVRGIATSLHGVAGAKSISALNRATKAYAALTIRKVDIAHDLAIIGSGEIDREPAWPVFPSGPLPVPNVEVVLWGHPYGLIQTDTTARVRTPALPIFLDVLPTSVRQPYIDRKSPDTADAVLFLQGPLVPGLSGAPVVASGKLVGVGDGGLEGGSTQLTWAIPLDSHVVWVDPPADLTAFSKDTRLFSDVADVPPELPIAQTVASGPDDLGADHFATTTVAVSEGGEVEYQTETRTQDPSNGFCVRPYVVLFDGEGQVLQTVGKGQPWCVGNIRGADVGIPNPPTRKDAFRAKLSVDTTARIRHVGVVHEIGSKDVAAAILADSAFRQAVWSRAATVSKQSQKVLVRRDIALPADGCERRSEKFSVTALGKVDRSRGLREAPGFEFDVRGNNDHGISDIGLVESNMVSFSVWAKGKGTNAAGVCLGAEGANVSVDVYAWVFDPD